MNFRIGYGFDVHQLSTDEEFILGGIKIDHVKGTGISGGMRSTNFYIFMRISDGLSYLGTILASDTS